MIIIIFLFGYSLNMFFISVLYHRGLTHRSIELSPIVMKTVALTGSWITGLDPKTWCCMHRLHHQHSDTKKDPHSPTHLGLWGVWLGQYSSYISIQKDLINKDETLSKLVEDIPFDVGPIYKNNLSWLPYLLHAVIGLFLWLIFSEFAFGAAYFIGILSHPVQGWMVNALAHKFGSRNFDTPDNSTNNHLVAWLVFGEGFQNNHHQHPKSAKFSFRKNEVDPGYMLCLLASYLGLLKIHPYNKPSLSPPRH